MASRVVEALDSFIDFSAPQIGLADSPFRLACWLDAPATEAEIAAFWQEEAGPTELIQMWRAHRSARLFEDVDYGQWGLHLLSPEEAARRTREEKAARPAEYKPGDIVIGEFLGDQELLVDAVEVSRECIVVALPLDKRPDWRRAADTVHDFLFRYRSALGGKYWDQL